VAEKHGGSLREGKLLTSTKALCFSGNLDIWIKSLNFNISPFRPLGLRGYRPLT